MQEAFLKVFSTGDLSQSIALWIILLLTFLLGMLVWALLAHFPSSRKLKISNKELTADNTVLKKDNKDLTERYTVINAKYNRASEELQTAEANLKEKNEKLEKQKGKILVLSDQLEVYKDNARNYKEANEKLMGEYKKIAALNEKYLQQVEDMKGLVEEVEKEKGGMLQDGQDALNAKKALELKFKKSSEKLEEAEKAIKLLKKDLDAALAQRAELKKMLLDLEATTQLEGTDDHDLKTQLIGLKSHVRELEAENTDLMERLAPYLAKEQQAQRESEEIDELLVNLLVDAEHNMEADGFFVDYEEEDLIDDKNYLEKTLGEEAAEDLPEEDQKEALIELDAEDEATLEMALKQSEEAMELQGFYGDIEKAVLMQSKDEKEPSSDGELLDKHLDATAEMLEKSLFFSENTREEGFVDDKVFLTKNLDELEFSQHPSDNEIENVILEDIDHAEMDAAMDFVVTAMEAEGLYSPIDSEKLLATEEDEINGSYESDLEQAVVQELGRTIPKALKSQKDDLQKIDGIGAFVEQRLNQFGIYTFEQITKFDEAFVVKLGAALGFSEQSITRDMWVEQAKALLQKA